MIIRVSGDLGREEIWANGVELSNIMGMDFIDGKRISFYPTSSEKFVYSIENPVLMTDNYRIGKLDPTTRDTLFSLFSCKPRIIEYDGVSTYWDERHDEVWCPSIDTLLFAKVLKKFLGENKGIKSAVEIGCGSGFLTKYVLEKSEVENMLAIDINPNAIKSVEDNINDERLRVFYGNGLNTIEGEKFDLIICNPPYIPRPGSVDDNPYEGIGLMRHLVQEGRKYLNKDGVLLINVSSLGWDLTFDKEPIMKMKILEKKDVPLKVNNILNNAEWVAYLEECGLVREMRDGYEYWQTLNILEFR